MRSDMRWLLLLTGELNDLHTISLAIILYMVLAKPIKVILSLCERLNLNFVIGREYDTFWMFCVTSLDHQSINGVTYFLKKNASNKIKFDREICWFFERLWNLFQTVIYISAVLLNWNFAQFSYYQFFCFDFIAIIGIIGCADALKATSLIFGRIPNVNKTTTTAATTTTTSTTVATADTDALNDEDVSISHTHVPMLESITSCRFNWPLMPK